MKSKAVSVFLRSILALTLLAGLLANSFTPVHAAGLCYVKYDSTGEKDGSSWKNAFNKLQSALGLSGCTEVWVARGTYVPTTDTDRTISFQLKSGVKIYGGFGGWETLVTQRNPTANVTILSGNIGSASNTADNSYHVVTAPGMSGATLLDGFVIQDGNANGAAPYDRGGGLYVTGGNPHFGSITLRSNLAGYGAGAFIGGGSGAVLSYITFDSNSAAHDGGGMYNSGSGPNLSNFTFTKNSAVTNGGGMYNSSSSPVISTGTFVSNKASYGGGAYSAGSLPSFTGVDFKSNTASVYGAGMYNATSDAVLTKMTFDSNAATQAGGGMYNTSSSPILKKSVFKANSAGYYGGGMYNASGSLASLRMVTFTANTAGDWGGGMLNSYSNAILKNVKFTRNSAYAGGGLFNAFSDPSVIQAVFSANTAHDGGAIYNDGSNAVLENITFQGNTASYTGGAVKNFSSNPVMNNLTISGNSAAMSGGGVHNDGSNPTITNTIIYGNTIDQVYNKNASAPTISYAIVQNGCPVAATCTSVLSSDPLLSTLGPYGGWTRTMVLAPASPAIDAGDNATCALVDQRGISRPRDGDGDGTATCDLGATESRYITATFISSAPYDGFIVESAENSSLGGGMNWLSSLIRVGDNAVDKQYRGILSFNTASLPDNATVRRAYVLLKLSGIVGTDPFTTHGNLALDIRQGAFSDDPVLQLIDFQALSSLNKAGIVSSIPLPGSWYQSTLKSMAIPFVNRAGLTQFRLRFLLDDNDNLIADYLQFYSGNATDPTTRPQLVVGYYLP